MVRKMKKGTQKGVVVLLEGNKASKESTGVAPLWKAINDVVGPEDQVLVLTLLYWNNIDDGGTVTALTPLPASTLVAATSAPSSSRDDIYNLNDIQTCDDDVIDDNEQALLIHDNPDVNFMYVKEIGQREKAYAEVFKPFYRTCQTYRVSVLFLFFFCFGISLSGLRRDRICNLFQSSISPEINPPVPLDQTNGFRELLTCKYLKKVRQKVET